MELITLKEDGLYIDIWDEDGVAMYTKNTDGEDIVIHECDNIDVAITYLKSFVVKLQQIEDNK